MAQRYPNPVVTFLPVYGHAVLMLRRSPTEANWPGRWAFPGGRVEIGETFLDALVRELAEETALAPAGTVAFLDSYMFGSSVGVAFAISVTTPSAHATDSEEIMWIEDESQLQDLDRIPGIDNHFLRAKSLLEVPDAWVRLEDANLIEAIYINR